MNIREVLKRRMAEEENLTLGQIILGARSIPATTIIKLSIGEDADLRPEHIVELAGVLGITTDELLGADPMLRYECPYCHKISSLINDDPIPAEMDTFWCCEHCDRSAMVTVRRFERTAKN